MFDIGGGRVGRRFRDSRRPADTVAREALVMAHLARHGYPVPADAAVVDGDLVMERLDGVTMLDDLAAHPWRVDAHARTWADLQIGLAAVPVAGLDPDALPVRFGPPAAILHLDFHPGNIMLTSRGPVVFDWTNASLGPPAADVAQAWIIAATSTVDGSRWVQALGRLLRRRLVNAFVDRCGRPAATDLLPAAARYRRRDRNVRPEEAARIDALVARHARSGP